MQMETNRRSILRRGVVGLSFAVAGCVTAPRFGGTGAQTGRETPTESPIATSVRPRARAIGKTIRPAVIVLQSNESMSSGTAWFLNEHHIVTNSHVIHRLGDFTCRTINGIWFDARVRAQTDPDGPDPDIAVLEADIEPPGRIPIGSSAGIDSGQPVVQVGHTNVGYWSISLGRIVDRTQRGDRPVILTEIPMMRGNSGSPLVTLDGNAIGLTVGSVPRPDRPPSTAPTPGPPTVHQRYPRRDVMFGLHLPIETVLEYINGLE